MKKIFSSFFVLACLVVFHGVVLAQVAENLGSFEAYEKGDLNDQDGWSDGWNALQVQDNLVFDGAKAIQNQEESETAGYKELPEGFFENGVMSAKIRIDGNNFSDNQQLFGLFKGVGEEYIALFRFANDFDGRGNTVLFSKAGSAEVMTLGEITQGEWHKASLGWRNSDFKIRVKIDNSEWTPWFDSQTSWHEGEPFGIRITLPPAESYGDFYLDDLKYFLGDEEPEYDPLLLAEEAGLASTTDEVVEEIPEETNTQGTVVTETGAASQTAAVAEAGGILDEIVDGLLDIISDGGEETAPTPEAPTDAPTEEENAALSPASEDTPTNDTPTAPSSVSADTEASGTVTTTF